MVLREDKVTTGQTGGDAVLKQMAEKTVGDWNFTSFSYLSAIDDRTSQY